MSWLWSRPRRPLSPSIISEAVSGAVDKESLLGSASQYPRTFNEGGKVKIPYEDLAALKNNGNLPPSVVQRYLRRPKRYNEHKGGPVIRIMPVPFMDRICYPYIKPAPSSSAPEDGIGRNHKESAAVILRDALLKASKTKTALIDDLFWDVDMILAPFHPPVENVKYWSLVVIYPTEGRIEYLDSYKARPTTTDDIVVELVIEFFQYFTSRFGRVQPNYNWHVSNDPTRGGSHEKVEESGVIMLSNIRALMDGSAPQFDDWLPNDLLRERNHIFARIVGNRT